MKNSDWNVLTQNIFTRGDFRLEMEIMAFVTRLEYLNIVYRVYHKLVQILKLPIKISTIWENRAVCTNKIREKDKNSPPKNADNFKRE